MNHKRCARTLLLGGGTLLWLTVFGLPVVRAQSGGTADSAADSLATASVTARVETPVAHPDAPVSVSGSVRDEQSGRALDYTNIIFERYDESGWSKQFHSGTIAVSGGEFFHRLPPGTYDATFLYLGYERTTTEPFEAHAGEPVRLEVELKVKPIEMQLVTVQAQRIRNTELAALTEKKRAVALQEAITSEEISRSTDSDAAEALERVTGLSVVGGKFVYVRGLGDRYSSTSLNGASLSSPEPGRRTVPLDIFPAAMLDNIVVQKTFTPDMDGEFGGGNIDVQTKDAVDSRRFSQKISYGYSENVLDAEFYSYRGSDFDFIALDDGTRELPGTLAPYGDRKLSGVKNFLGDGLERTELADIRSSFRNVWTPRRDGAPANFSYSALLADGFEVGGRRGSFLVGSSLSNSFNTRLYEQLDIRGGSQGTYNARTQFDKIQSTHSTLLGINGALTLLPTNGSNLTYNFLYTRSADDQAQIAEGLNDQSERIRQTVLEYVERDLMSHVVQGNHVLFGDATRLQWLGSTSRASRERPDTRFAEYKWDTVDVITDPDDPEEIIDLVEGWGKSPLGYPFQRSFTSSEEDDQGLKVSLEQKLPETPFTRQGLELGWSFRERERSTRYRVFGIACRGCEFAGSGRGEDTFSEALYEDTRNPDFLDELVIAEISDPKDSYRASQRTNAGYAMLDLDVARVRIVGGARYESSRQDVVAGDFLGNEDFLTAELDTDDILPALNGTWRITDAVNLRSSYSRTVNRPEMRELAPLRLFNYEIGIEEQGNRFLEQAEIDAYDVRLEYFPGLRRYMSASLFRKDLRRPIERVLVAQAAGNLKEVPGNAEEGDLRGWELEWRGGVENALHDAAQVSVTGGWLATRPLWLVGQVPGLGLLEKLTVPFVRVARPDLPLLRNWGLTFNYSRIDSEVRININDVTNEGILTLEPGASVVPGDVEKVAPLTGQSTYAFNAGILYGNGRRDFSLMLKAFGDRLEAFGAGSPDLYERVPTSLDMAVSQKLGSSLKIKLGVENILDERRELYYDAQEGESFQDVDQNAIDDPVRISLRDGRRFSLSLTYAPWRGSGS